MIKSNHVSCTTFICILSTIIFSICTAPTKEFTSINRESPHTITFFIKPMEIATLQEELKEIEQKKITLKLKNPLKIQKILFQQKFNPKNMPHQGINITYAGTTKIPDENGQITFSKKHSSDEILIIVTEQIDPIIIRGNTVEYFIRNSTKPINYYKINRYFNQENYLYYWKTEKIAPPLNKKIPLSAFVIFAKPKTIYLPQEQTIAMKGSNLLLPVIYTKKQNNFDLNSLLFLKIKQFFAPEKTIIKKAPKRYGKIIQ